MWVEEKTTISFHPIKECAEIRRFEKVIAREKRWVRRDGGTEGTAFIKEDTYFIRTGGQE